MKDEISFGFGIASLICWGIAEIPQIITNLKNKSADGVSLAFISTWILGDVFNLMGCILEPATIPTQFYTALVFKALNLTNFIPSVDFCGKLYTTTTIVLALQCLYYGHFLPRWKCPKVTSDNYKVAEDGSLSTTQGNSPIEVPPRRDFHFMSVRSLAGSDNSVQSSYIKQQAKSGPPALYLHTDSSSEDENVQPPRPIPRSVGGSYGTFVAASAYLPLGSEAASNLMLGWLMAAIYMGGRFPQIFLNVQYIIIYSILVRSTEWEKIKANMPWLLDAVVCVGLDLFIILQYVYYGFISRKKEMRDGEYYGDYEEANYKQFVPS
ncbi:hypothetical protein M9H77_24802 [Catharanthus roseus]|uniref:Uncharacterized protein n=1 Tax=Catharanthus roseus TaxID=4058 RepID=A0ACC0A741_CATRO|nr:hypothetical protein M9H77_24802 [Catharanthus roseus]